MLAGILCCKMLLLSCLMMQDRGLTRGGSEEALATRNFRIQKRKEKEIYYYKLPPWPGLDSKSQRGICLTQCRQARLDSVPPPLLSISLTGSDLEFVIDINNPHITSYLYWFTYSISTLDQMVSGEFHIKLFL